MAERGLRHGAKGVGQTFVGKSLALLGSLGQRAFCGQLPRVGMFQRSTGSTESFFFLKKEPTVISESVALGPCFSAGTLKACAFGCPKSPVWSGDGFDLKEKAVRILHPWSITSTMSITSPLKSLGRIGQVK